MSDMRTPQHPDHEADGHFGHGHNEQHNGLAHDAAGQAHLVPGGITPGMPGGAAHDGVAHDMPHDGTAHGGGTSLHATHHGRDKIDWPPEVWHRIDAAVKEEIRRSRVGAKFLPTVHVPSKSTTIPADVVTNPAVAAGSGALGNAAPLGALYVDESETTRVNEFWVEFSLTPAQVEEEVAAVHGIHNQHPSPHQHHQHNLHHQVHASTGISLATRAANILAQVEDTVLFQGQGAFKTPLFLGANSPIGYRFQTTDFGLLNLRNTNFPGNQIQQVNLAVPVSLAAPNGAYQEKTVAAIAQAFSILQGNGQYGPYALVLQTTPFADANSPLPTTLITPAEPIRHLMNAGFYGTGALPTNLAAVAASPPTVVGWPAIAFTGFVVSLGGNTMDLVRGKMHAEEDVHVRFEQKDANGYYRFRVVERFALRLKDITAVVQLQFQAS